MSACTAKGVLRSPRRSRGALLSDDGDRSASDQHDEVLTALVSYIASTSRGPN